MNQLTLWSPCLCYIAPTRFWIYWQHPLSLVEEHLAHVPGYLCTVGQLEDLSIWKFSFQPGLKLIGWGAHPSQCYLLPSSLCTNTEVLIPSLPGCFEKHQLGCQADLQCAGGSTSTFVWDLPPLITAEHHQYDNCIGVIYLNTNINEFFTK